MDRYDTNNDHYCYSGTNVLKNKLGITDIHIFEAAEREITAAAIPRVIFRSPPFDLSHFQDIHRALFSDLYKWAGEIRDVNITKSSTPFCFSDHIESEAGKLFKKLHKERNLNNVNFSHFVKRFSWYYCEFNMIHPFREGNGRVQRLFFEYLASINGYLLDWRDVSKEEWIQANIDGVFIGNDKLEAIFTRILQPIIFT